jgi:hypothetical protein
MNDAQPLHRFFRHYSELPYSLRVLFSCMLLMLGVGYLFALLNIYFTYAGRAGGNPAMLGPADLIVAYSGNGTGTKLESALSGPMSTMLPPEEKSTILAWVHDGSKQAGYDGETKAIFDKRCLTCHDGRNPHLPMLANFEGLKKVTEADTGASVATLVRVSHIHLFGVTFIFFIVGFCFTHAYVRPVWLKSAVIATPFLCNIVDVSSWYLIKLFHPFVYVEILAGMVMASCFAFMWVVSMWQMWFSKPPAAVLERLGGDVPAVG